MYLFQLYFSQGICPVLGLLSHMVVLFLAFKGISILFSIVAGSICISTNSARGFPFLHTLSLSLIVCRFFDDGCSDWCAVISHCNFKIIWENSVCLFVFCRKFEGKLMFPSLCRTFLWPPEVKAAGKRQSTANRGCSHRGMAVFYPLRWWYWRSVCLPRLPGVPWEHIWPPSALCLI